MDREAYNEGEDTSLLPDHNNNKLEEPQRKLPQAAHDRLKRDEWSEGAVSCLLEAYEAKWILRNRAKLKGQDWEDVAKYVSARSNSTKSPKTQTQCKNKIESMKKRYRSESATADASSWPLYSRLDLLLRGNAPPPPPPPPLPPPPPPPPEQTQLPTSLAAPNPPLVVLLEHMNVTQNSDGSNGVDRVAKVSGTLDCVSRFITPLIQIE